MSFLLWIFCVFFCLVFAMSLWASVYMCLVVTCWERAALLAPSRLWCLTVSLSLSHWYPGSGVVLDCIDSWSLHPYFLCNSSTCVRYQNAFVEKYNYSYMSKILKNFNIIHFCLSVVLKKGKSRNYFDFQPLFSLELNELVKLLSFIGGTYRLTVPHI